MVLNIYKDYEGYVISVENTNTCAVLKCGKCTSVVLQCEKCTIVVLQRGKCTI